MTSAPETALVAEESTEFDPVGVAELLRKRGRVRGEPVAISLFADAIPEQYEGAQVEPCAIVREAMDFGRHVYVDAENHSCLAGAWQAGFIDPPPEISSGKYLATNTDFFTEEGAFAVKNGDNVLPRGTVVAIGACPLDKVPEGVSIDVVVVVCDPSIAAMIGGVRVAVDGTPPTGAAGTSLCGDLFALPWHDPNVIISTGDVGGRMFNKIKPSEMFVIIPAEFAGLIPSVLGSRPDLTGLLDAIKPGYAEVRIQKRAEREAAGEAVAWDPEATALLAAAPDAIRDFAGPTMEEYAREQGKSRVTVGLIEEQMASVGVNLQDVIELSEESGADDAPNPDSVSQESGSIDSPVDVDDLGPGKVRHVATSSIAASPERVWGILVDAARWPNWYADIRKVEVTGELGEGAEFRFVTGPVKVKATVETFEPGTVLTILGKSKGSLSRYRFTLRGEGDSAGAGSTVVSLRQVTSGLAANTMTPVLQRIADSSLDAWLAALAVEAESDSESGK